MMMHLRTLMIPEYGMELLTIPTVLYNGVVITRIMSEQSTIFWEHLFITSEEYIHIFIPPTKVLFNYLEWIHLATDRDQWWALSNTVMNLWFP